MWAIARFDLGLSDKEFGAITPAMLDALLRRKQAREQQEFLRTGIVAAAIINFSMSPPKEPVSARDFVPDFDGTKEEKEEFDLRNLSPEDQKRYIIDMFSKKVIG